MFPLRVTPRPSPIRGAVIRLIVALALGTTLLTISASITLHALVRIEARRAADHRVREFERASSLLQRDLEGERTPASGASLEVGADASLRLGPFVSRDGERVWHEWRPLAAGGWVWWRTTEGSSRVLVLNEVSLRVERLGDAGRESWPEFGPAESPVEPREDTTEVWYDRDRDRVWSATPIQEIAGQRWFSQGPAGAAELFQRATGDVLRLTLQPNGISVRVSWNETVRTGPVR